VGGAFPVKGKREGKNFTGGRELPIKLFKKGGGGKDDCRALRGKKGEDSRKNLRGGEKKRRLLVGVGEGIKEKGGPIARLRGKEWKGKINI